MDEYLGIIKAFGGNYAPRGFMLCQGQILPISNWTALFSILGTTYGGNGQNTFALPDLRSRVPVGSGQGPGLSYYVLGQIAGTESVSLNIGNMPPHNHPITGTVKLPVNGDSANTDSPDSSYLGPVSTGNLYNSQASPNVFGGNMAVNLTTAVMGSSIPFSIVQPYLALNYIICVEGVFPARN